MTKQDLHVWANDDTQVVVTRRQSPGPSVVLLHAGVADRRSWDAVGESLSVNDLDVVAYDRRGYGDTPAATDPSSFTHVDDLMVVLDRLGIDQALLVGNSMGGALALDAAMLHDSRVSGLVLIGAGVSGMTDDDTPFDWQLDPASAPLLERADDANLNVEDRIAALAHLWLDGPTAAEGRVGGTPRDLFIAMNRRIFDIGAPDDAGGAGQIHGPDSRTSPFRPWSHGATWTSRPTCRSTRRPHGVSARGPPASSPMWPTFPVSNGRSLSRTWCGRLYTSDDDRRSKRGDVAVREAAQDEPVGPHRPVDGIKR